VRARTAHGRVSAAVGALEARDGGGGRASAAMQTHLQHRQRHRRRQHLQANKTEKGARVSGGKGQGARAH